MNPYVEQMRAAKVHRGSVTVWWLGQNGFVFKTPQGTLLSIDAYLTNSCEALGASVGLNLSRAVPLFIQPPELEVDFFLCTHSHQDHADPETIAGLRSDAMTFAGPGLACEVFERCGISRTRMTQMYAGGRQRFADVTVHGAFALPTDDTDLNHIGMLLEFDDGPRVYVTGDTDYSDLLASVAKQKPDVVITCINGGFNNLSHWEAADLVRLVQPRIAIPCHYDMFPDNHQDPESFRAALKYKAPDSEYVRLEHVQPFTIAAS